MSNKPRVTEQKSGCYQKWLKRQGCMAWYARLKHDGRTHRAGPFETKTEAKEAVVKLRAEVQKGMVKERMTVAEFAEEFLESARLETPETAQQYAQRLKHLLPFFGHQKLDQVKAVDIKAYRKHRLSQDPKPKPATINRELSVLSRMFTVALEDERILYHPMVKRRLKLHEEKEPPKVLSEDDRLKLLAACKLNLKFECFEPMITFALNTGLRAMEVLNLRWHAVDMEQRIISVVKSKSKKPRYIPMNDLVYETLSNLDRTTEYVFPFNRDGDFRSRFEHQFADLCELAGLGIRFHGLRATFATRLTDNKVSVRVVQVLLGHSSPVVTERYVRTDRSLEDAVRTLHRGQKRGHFSDEDLDENE